jgi:hypothetical protein
LSTNLPASPKAQMLSSVVLLEKTTAVSKLLPYMYELHLTESNTIFKLFSSFLPAKDSITIRKKIRKVAFIISFWNQFQVWIKLKNFVRYYSNVLVLDFNIWEAIIFNVTIIFKAQKRTKWNRFFSCTYYEKSRMLGVWKKII